MMQKISNIESARVKIEGIAPLIMHNGQLADPTNPHSMQLKELSRKRKKTDQDHLDMKKVEFIGGLYHDPQTGPYLPDLWIEKNIRDGAAAFKQGKLILSGVQVEEQKVPLLYDGPRDIENLYADGRFVDTRGVVVQRSRIMRTRPIFPTWSAAFTVNVITSVISSKDVRRALEQGGLFVGVGDYRPKFGRYRVIEFKVV